MRYNCATLRHAVSRQKNLYFPLPQESMRTTFHYPESPYGRTYADVITKISRIDSLPNYLSYGAPLERASRARSSAITRPVSFILITPQYRLSLFVTYHLHHHHHHSFVTVSFNYLLLLLCFSFAVFTVRAALRSAQFPWEQLGGREGGKSSFNWYSTFCKILAVPRRLIFGSSSILMFLGIFSTCDVFSQARF